FEVALHDLDRGGLARAVGAEQREHLPPAYLEGDAVHRDQVAVSFAQPGDLDHRLAHAQSPVLGEGGGPVTRRLPGQPPLDPTVHAVKALPPTELTELAEPSEPPAADSRSSTSNSPSGLSGSGGVGTPSG